MTCKLYVHTHTLKSSCITQTLHTHINLFSKEIREILKHYTCMYVCMYVCILMVLHIYMYQIQAIRLISLNPLSPYTAFGGCLHCFEGWKMVHMGHLGPFCINIFGSTNFAGCVFTFCHKKMIDILVVDVVKTSTKVDCFKTLSWLHTCNK